MSKKIKALQTLGLIAGTTVAVGCLGVAGYAIADGAITLPTQAETPTVTPPQDVSTVVTDTAITVSPVENAEYSLDGKTWQDSNIFLGLQPAQEYTVYIRIKATEDTPASEPATVQVTTDKSMQAVPQINAPEATADSIIFEQIEGLEYSINNCDTWQDSNIFNNLQPATEYTVLVRYAETATHYASDTVSFIVSTTKAEQLLVPDIDTAEEITADSITLPAISGVEYSINNSTWQTSNIFNNLQPATEYTIYMRYAETDTTFVGETVTILVTTSVDALPYTVASIDEEAKTITISAYTGDATELVVPAKMSVQNINGTNYAVAGTAYDVIVDRFAFRDTQLVTLDLSAITTPCSFVGDNIVSGKQNYTTNCFPSTLEEITFPKQVSGIGVNDYTGNYCSDTTFLDALYQNGPVNAFINQEADNNNKQSNIKAINISDDGNGTYFSSINGVLYSADKTTLLFVPSNYQSTDFTVPNGVTKIADYAFYSLNKKLNNLQLSESVQEIGCYATQSKVINFVFAKESNLTTIKDYGFYTEQTSLTIPEGVENLGKFFANNVQELYLPSSLNSLNQKGTLNNLLTLTDYSLGALSAYFNAPKLENYYTANGTRSFNSFAQKYPKLKNIKFLKEFDNTNLDYTKKDFIQCLELAANNSYFYNYSTEENNSNVAIVNNLLIIKGEIIAIVNTHNGEITLPNNYKVGKLKNLSSINVDTLILQDEVSIPFSSNILNKISNLVLLSETPKLSQNIIKSNIQNYYVPDASVETYKTAWTNVADKIKPISEKPTTE